MLSTALPESLVGISSGLNEHNHQHRAAVVTCRAHGPATLAVKQITQYAGMTVSGDGYRVINLVGSRSPGPHRRFRPTPHHHSYTMVSVQENWLGV